MEAKREGNWEASLSGTLQRVEVLGRGKLSIMELGASRKMGILFRVPQGPVLVDGVADDVPGVSLGGVWAGRGGHSRPSPRDRRRMPNRKGKGRVMASGTGRKGDIF